MSILPTWVPNIHPLLVHFPIALLFFAAAMDFLTFFVPEKWWNETMTVITYVIGFISIVVVYFTGNMAAGSLHPVSPAVQHAIEQHRTWALGALWFFAIYTLLRLFLYFTGKMSQLKWHLLLFLISFGGLFLLFKTGEYGGELVFKYHVNEKLKQKSVINPNKTVYFGSEFKNSNNEPAAVANNSISQQWLISFRLFHQNFD